MAMNFTELSRFGTNSILMAHGVPIGADGPRIDAMASLALKHDWHIGIQRNERGWQAEVRDALDRSAVLFWTGSSEREADAIGQAVARALDEVSARKHW